MHTLKNNILRHHRAAKKKKEKEEDKTKWKAGIQRSGSVLKPVLPERQTSKSSDIQLPKQRLETKLHLILV